MSTTLHWKWLKEFCLERGKGRCEECKARLFPGCWHLHHLTYARKGHERTTDVRAICLDCHGKHHPRHSFKPTPTGSRGPRRKKVKSTMTRHEKWAKQCDDAWLAINGKHLEKLAVTKQKPDKPAERRYAPGKKFG